MPSETSELRDTKTVRFNVPPAGSAVGPAAKQRETSSRVPVAGEDAIFREWCSEAKGVVSRRAVITHVNAPNDPDSTVTLTVFTPATPAGTLCRNMVGRGTEVEQWDYP
jgi:hypothetical protein